MSANFVVRLILPLFLLAGAQAEHRTVASLHDNAGPDLPPMGAVRVAVTTPHKLSASETSLPETARGRAAAKVLFVDGDPVRAARAAAMALRMEPRDAEALFVRMEAAAMLADRDSVVDAALWLCELAGRPIPDARVELAAERLRESAENTATFRSAIPRIRQLIKNSAEPWPGLNEALLSAAMDGVPELSPASLARGAGILTDWRMVGPLGRHATGEMDSVVVTSSAPLAESRYENRTVENFQFPDGKASLPEYMQHRGTVYAASQFAVLEGGPWTMRVETQAAAEIYLDGRLALPATAGQASRRLELELPAGPHRVLVKFASSPGWWRIRANPELPGTPEESRVARPAVETSYLKAARLYATGQLTALSAAAAEENTSIPAATLFLLAQAESRQNATSAGAVAAWQTLLLKIPQALAGEEALAGAAAEQHHVAEATLRAGRMLAKHPDNEAALRAMTLIGTPQQREQAWQSVVAAHPSCSVLTGARQYYREQGDTASMALTDIALRACAPGSLAYAQVLSEAQLHAPAAEALREVIATSPLDRAARAMLVRELQLAGDDAGARLAAVEWIAIAPNAGSYRRLAAVPAEAPESEAQGSVATAPFYAPYRRELPDTSLASNSSSTEIVLDDHVAVVRPDGSVSLYLHTATRIGDGEAAERLRREASAPGAQQLSVRLRKSDGVEIDLQQRQSGWSRIESGDIVEQEWVVNYAGDGGIGDHPEVFQFVFGWSQGRVLQARFVVLTPPSETDRGVVIVTGEAPAMQSRATNGMLVRIWDSSADAITATSINATEAPAASEKDAGFAIVRVVDKENGWTVPRNAERRKRIDTPHPGPRPANA